MSLRNILKGLLDPETYRFPSAEELGLEEESPPEAPGEEEAYEDTAPSPEGEEPVLEEEEAPPGEEGPAASPEPSGPVQYAQLQAELILKRAREEAEELLANARAAAKAEQEEIRMGARDEGYREGYAQGIGKAMEDAQRDKEAVAARMEKEVQAFLEKADMAREEVLLQARDELLDLCIAVAEKVVRVSLKSSSEVIVRMIQTATERLKRQEWVHIYISGCDTKGVAQISPALTTALGALSQHVKIIPMGDDEGGTCIVETPEEIIDASVSTQMTNIRDLLRDQMGAF
ncbi:MAG: F0F1 ATP synthase subunit delta [Oscillospiraceae bacterium]|nr:F0F1 ATP synthase subunit delta [Oscillospiraceae bacterium]MCI8943085.1 F0F1 ATP synthase subunit delta [Oscillospiraceae bacterium]